MRIFMTIMMFAFAYAANASQDYERIKMEKRIKPIGQVRVQEELADKPVAAVVTDKAVAKKEESPGKKIYDQYCHVCHQAGVAGAPKFQNAGDWKSRMQGKSVDDLVAVAVKGLNAMPAKGTCMQCSDADIKAAVEYMLPKS